MTEDHGTYQARPQQPEDELDGVQPIGDILRQLVDERGWQIPQRTGPTNGQLPGHSSDRRHHDG